MPIVTIMHIGFIGLGKMGGNMALRLTVGSGDGKVRGGHQVTGFAKDPNSDFARVEGGGVEGEGGERGAGRKKSNRPPPPPRGRLGGGGGVPGGPGRLRG